MRLKKMSTVTRDGNYIEELKNLALFLAKALDSCDDAKSVSQISRQYRETIKEIEAINGGVIEDDEIGEILSNRDGESDSVRKNRSGL